MKIEPVYIAQNAGAIGFQPDEVADWFRARALEAKERGCKFCRFSQDDKRGWLLVEGWDRFVWELEPEGQGDVRWQVAAEKSDGGPR